MVWFVLPVYCARVFQAKADEMDLGRLPTAAILAS